MCDKCATTRNLEKRFIIYKCMTNVKQFEIWICIIFSEICTYLDLHARRYAPTHIINVGLSTHMANMLVRIINVLLFIRIVNVRLPITVINVRSFIRVIDVRVVRHGACFFLISYSSIINRINRKTLII